MEKRTNLSWEMNNRGNKVRTKKIEPLLTVVLPINGITTIKVIRNDQKCTNLSRLESNKC